jgi:mono/diheme cytochrome c family protein
MNRLPALAGRIVVALVSTASAVHAETDAAKVETGATVYGDYCSSCHGEGLKNTSGGVTFDLRRLRPEDRDRFLHGTLNGKGQMPPWRGALEMEQIEAIWAYIRATVDR